MSPIWHGLRFTSPRRASLPDLIPHSINIHRTHTQKNVHMESNSSSSCCTILFISDVHNDHDINSQHIFIIHDVKTLTNIKNIYKYCHILFYLM